MYENRKQYVNTDRGQINYKCQNIECKYNSPKDFLGGGLETRGGRDTGCFNNECCGTNGIVGADDLPAERARG